MAARKLLKFVKDVTWPVLSTLTLVSSNATNTLAKVGDVITFTIASAEALNNVLVVAGVGNATVVKNSDYSYSATYTMTSSDTAGTLTFAVSARDSNWAQSTTSVKTGGNNVTFDKTSPTLSSAAKDSVTQITVTLSELAAAASITKSNTGGFTVSETGTPWTTYAVSAVAPGATNNLAVLTVADMTASAAAGVTVKYASGGNGTVADPTGNLMATNATGVIIAAWA